MTAPGAFREGLRRVNHAPAVLAGVVFLTFSLALPLSIVLRGMLEEHLGHSATAEALADGADYGWWDEFRSQASGLGTTFTPSVIGFAAILENLDTLLDNRPLAATVGGVSFAWMVLWSFLSGGVLDRYARARPTHPHGFFAACGTHFFRFVRLGMVAGLAYLLLFGPVHEWVFGAYRWLTRDITAERAAFAVRLCAYAVFSAFLAIFSVWFDYARVRIVVEDRRSALGALAAGGRFIRRQPRQVFGLYLLNALALLVLMAAYGVLVALGGPRSGLRLWAALLLGQAYIIGRHYVKLLVYASEIALFQSALAHAAYTSSPALEWPESPAVETITNAAPGERG